MKEHFESKFTPEPMSGCWLWDSPRNDRFGYGYYRNRKNRKILAAHRLAWSLYRGPIPDGICVLHKCDTPACVNPDHLFLGTRADNNRDMNSKNRGNNQTKTHCKAGHSLDGSNLFIAGPTKSRPIPYRQCRICRREAGRKRNEKMKLKRRETWQVL